MCQYQNHHKKRRVKPCWFCPPYYSPSFHFLSRYMVTIRILRSCFDNHLSKVFHQTKYGEDEEEELDCISDCCHETASGHFHTAFYPEPARWHRIGPTDDADHQTENCTQCTYNKRCWRRVFKQVQSAEDKRDGTDILEYPKKVCHINYRFAIFSRSFAISFFSSSIKSLHCLA